MINQPDGRISFFQPLMLSNSVDQTPFLGGNPQRVNRLGDRWGAAFGTPPMREGTARAWEAFMTAAQGGETVVMDWIEIWQPRRSYGTPLVRGAGQSGTSLLIDGLPPHARIEAAKFFSIFDGSKRSIHKTIEISTADASGIATLNFSPMLPFPPSDNAVIELARPKLQGRMDPKPELYSFDVNRLVGCSFTVRAVYD